MLSIGVTGSLGTGKTTVARLFARQGARVVDADAIARRLIGIRGACHRRVVKEFGKEILSGRTIDRRKLAAIVFSDPKKRRRLESSIHPFVRMEIIRQFQRYKKTKSIMVVDVPLLFESGFDRLMNFTVVVKANRRQQLARITKRRTISRREALRRIKAQWPIVKKIALADFVVDNRGPLGSTQRQVKQIWKKVSKCQHSIEKE